MRQTIEDYKILKSIIPELIAMSGYKNNFIAQKIGIRPPSFADKKKKGNWTCDELEKILSIIESEELDDYYFGILIQKRKEYLCDNKEY